MGPGRRIHTGADLLTEVSEARPARRAGRYGAAVARSLPFAVYIGFLALAPILTRVFGAAFDPRWLYAAQVGLAAAALAACWRRYGELHEAPAPAGLAAGAAVGALVFALWINLDFGPLVLRSSEGFDPTTDGRVEWRLALTRLAGATLVVPVMEEVFWRAFILRWLHRPRFLDVDPREVGWQPLLISSAVFATEHHLWFAGLLAGLAYGWLYIRTGNVWVPVAAHAVTNGLLGWWVLATGSWTFW